MTTTVHDDMGGSENVSTGSRKPKGTGHALCDSRENGPGRQKPQPWLFPQEHGDQKHLEGACGMLIMFCFSKAGPITRVFSLWSNDRTVKLTNDLRTFLYVLTFTKKFKGKKDFSIL